MKILIVEDDFTSRLLLQKWFESLTDGECHIAINGEEAMQAISQALDDNDPYALICLDIMMPGLDGHGVLKALRELEDKHEIPLGKGMKVIMTTALGDRKNIMSAFRERCDAYLVKPLDKRKLVQHLKEFELI